MDETLQDATTEFCEGEASGDDHKVHQDVVGVRSGSAEPGRGDREDERRLRNMQCAVDGTPYAEPKEDADATALAAQQSNGKSKQADEQEDRAGDGVDELRGEMGKIEIRGKRLRDEGGPAGSRKIAA